MIGIIFILSLIYIVFFLKLASASNVGLIENSQWEANLTGVRFPTTAFGDIDNDGDLDLVLSGCLGGAGADRCTVGTITKIYINNGTTLTENKIWQQNLIGVGWGSLALGDINNDGRLDLVLSGCTNVSDNGDDCDSGTIISKIYLNNGTSLIESSQWQSNLTGVFDSSLALGDINNDGRLDLVLNGRSATSHISKIYINDGITLIESLQWQSNLTAIYEGQVALGDVNNDGKLDLALTGEKGSATDYTNFYLNNGTSFLESTQWSINLVNMDRSSIVFHNYDNNNYLDMMICGHTNGDECKIYKNNGSTFSINQSETDSPAMPGLYRASFAFGDYDNDGDLDFFSMGYEDGRTKTYENNETNHYFFQNDALSHANISNDIVQGAVAWGDVDNDGDLDLVIASIDAISGIISSKIFINNNTIPNTKPSSPTTNFSSNYSNAILNLSWENGSDSETNTLGLYYNLRVGNTTNNNSIVSGVYSGSSGGGGGSGGGANGYFGNMMQRKSISLNINLSNGTYYWYVQTIDTGLAKSDWSAVQNFTVGTVSDTTAPTISSISSSVTSSSATITWNTNELSNSTVYYGTPTALGSSSSSANLVASHSVSLSSLSASPLYYYNVSSCDSSRNCNTSSQYNFTTSAASVDNGNTGGGGGGTATAYKTYAINDEQLLQGYTQILSKNDKIKFSINNINHSLIVNNINKTENYANLTLNSTAFNFIIYVNETKKFELTNDTYYDLFVKFNNITDNKANLTIKQIYEKIEVGGKEEKAGESKEEKKAEEKVVNEEEKNVKTGKLLWIGFGVIALMIILIIFSFIKIKFRGTWRRKKENKNGSNKNR